MAAQNMPVKTAARKQQIKTRMDAIAEQVTQVVSEMTLRPRVREELVRTVAKLAMEVEVVDREIARCQTRLGVSGEAGARLLKQLLRGPKSRRRRPASFNSSAEINAVSSVAFRFSMACL